MSLARAAPPRYDLGSGGERAEHLASVSDERLAVREKQVVEVELGEPSISLAQSLLRPLRLVHQRVRDEPERTSLLPAHRAVGDRERPVRGKVERGLVGTDRTDPMGDDAPRKLVPEVEGQHGLTALELVQALTDATDEASKRSTNYPLER